MKHYLVILAMLLVFPLDSRACEYLPPSIGVSSCPCVEVIKGSFQEAAAAAQACGQAAGNCNVLSPGYCRSIIDDQGNPLHPAACCGCSLDNPGSEYCWTNNIPPRMGGCCGIGHCYYYKVPEEETCCKEEEGACCPEGASKCPQDKTGNPISVLSGQKEEVETDLEFNSPHEKGFRFYRTYKSHADTDAFSGYGWTHNYHVVLTPAQFGDAVLYKIRDEHHRAHYFQDTQGLGIYLSIDGGQSFLAQEIDGTLTWHRGNNITYTFDADLKFTTKTDGHGNTQRVEYRI